MTTAIVIGSTLTATIDSGSVCLGNPPHRKTGKLDYKAVAKWSDEEEDDKRTAQELDIGPLRVTLINFTGSFLEALGIGNHPKTVFLSDAWDIFGFRTKDEVRIDFLLSLV